MKKIYKSFLMLILVTSGMLTNLKAQECPWAITQCCNQQPCPDQCNGVLIANPVGYPAGFTFTFLWSTGSTANALRELCSGTTYTVTVTDDKGCSQVATYTMQSTAPIEPKCEVGQKESYPGAHNGSVVISIGGGQAPYEVQWNTNPVQYGLTATGLGAGSYTATITDHNKCTATITCTVEVNQCGGYRTQTQGGWGQCQTNGNNPGTYLAAHFAGAFPNGLTVGCNRTLRLTSVAAVCDFLPSGSSPSILPANKLNPGQGYSNVFAGQVVALTLSVRFDLVDPNFAPPAGHLGDLIINSGLFTNWTVNQLLAEANKKLGNCASVYSCSQLSDAVAKVNENFVDGTVNRGFLNCPSAVKLAGENTATEGLNYTVFPNPASQNAVLTIRSDKQTDIKVELYNIIGKKVSTLSNVHAEAGETQEMNLNLSTVADGIYILNIVTAEKTYQEKLVIKK